MMPQRYDRRVTQGEVAALFTVDRVTDAPIDGEIICPCNDQAGGVDLDLMGIEWYQIAPRTSLSFRNARQDAPELRIRHIDRPGAVQHRFARCHEPGDSPCHRQAMSAMAVEHSAA